MGRSPAQGAEPTRPLAGVDRRTAPPGRVDRRLLVAGQLAIVGATLLVAGMFPPYKGRWSLWALIGAANTRDPMWWYAVYVIIVAILALGAGIATLRPRMGRLVGPALLLGIVAASCWGLLFVISERFQDLASAQELDLDAAQIGGGWWFQLVAHLVLVLAACIAGVTLAGTGEIRLMRRPPQDKLAWLVALLGGAGALALLFDDLNLWQLDLASYRWYVLPSVWVTVMALAVPACAALAVPRRFGVALLGGWIGGAATLVYFNVLWHRWITGVSQTPMITLGFTLVALLVVTVFFARAAPKSQSEYTT